MSSTAQGLRLSVCQVPAEPARVQRPRPSRRTSPPRRGRCAWAARAGEAVVRGHAARRRRPCPPAVSPRRSSRHARVGARRDRGRAGRDGRSGCRERPDTRDPGDPWVSPGGPASRHVCFRRPPPVSHVGTWVNHTTTCI